MEKLKPGNYNYASLCDTLKKIFYFCVLLSFVSYFVRHTFGEFNTGTVFAYVGFIHITKHMGFVESEKFDGIETRNVTAVQQCARCTRSEGIFHHIKGENDIFDIPSKTGPN